MRQEKKKQKEGTFNPLLKFSANINSETGQTPRPLVPLS
jgi:hypothetical protein